MKFTPRWYQSESVAAFFDYYGTQGGTKNGIICLPTGSGKTFTMTQIIKETLSISPSAKILVVTHVKELIANNHKSLKKVWPRSPAGIYSAGLRRRQSNMQVTFCGIGSVAKRAEEFGHIDLVLVDECHTISDKADTLYRGFFKDLAAINERLIVTGLTATPYRLGMGHLLEGGLFERVIYDGCSFDAINRMIAEGYLANLVPYTTGVTIDVAAIGCRGGEFIASEADKAINTCEITSSAVTAICEAGKDRKHWMIFAQSIDHCNQILDELKGRGVSVVAVHSKMLASERDQNIIDFTAGKVRALVNMGVLTTGFDFPALDLLAVLRLTNSTALWLQILGRGMRPFKGKENCLVLDFADNTLRLGQVNDPVIPAKKGEGKGGTAPVRICPDCDAYMHTSKKVCEECGYEFPVLSKLQEMSSDRDLVAKGHVNLREYKVDGVMYGRHEGKDGKPDSLRVEYITDCRKPLTQFISIEAGWIAGSKQRAAQWLHERCVWDEIPHTLDMFLLHQSHFRKPASLIVNPRGKYPVILEFIWAVEAQEDDPF